MSLPDPAAILIDHLGQTGDPEAAQAGDRIAGDDLVLIEAGAAARLLDGAIFAGLATRGEAFGLEEGGETGRWLSAGRFRRLNRMAFDAFPVDVRDRCRAADARLKLAAARVRLREDQWAVRERVAHLIADIHAAAGESEIRLRQSDIGELLQVRRAGVSDACRVLEVRGLIRINRGRIVLIRPEALRSAV